MAEIDLRPSASGDGSEPGADVDTDVIDLDAPAQRPGSTGPDTASATTVLTLVDGPDDVRHRTGTIGLAERDRAVQALRALPFGGSDDASLGLRLPAPAQATVSPIIAAVRWGAVMYGMVTAVTRANNGDLHVVAALGTVLFLTTWRTLRPIRLGAGQRGRRLLPLFDAVLVGAAVGWSGNVDSPFVFCILAAAVVASFGWGLGAGAAATALGTAAMIVAALVVGEAVDTGSGRAPVLAASFALVVSMVAFARARLLEAETRRATLAGQLDLLAETNDLLHLLNDLARTLPQSLDLREALGATRTELRRSFAAEVIALVTVDELTGQWVPQITDGCALAPVPGTDALPGPLRAAAEGTGPVLVSRFAPGEGLGARSASGLYLAVRARGRTVGVLGVEHRDAGHYGGRHVRLMTGLGDVLALTVDNARSFARLRTLGADEERSRIARDLHDRLGQWLSYINFELERIIATSTPDHDELDRLHRDVQQAIDELRETLRQLRTEVTDARSFAMVARELVDRFNDRAEREHGPVATLVVTNPGHRLAARVENELLRILQEALSNIAKHAAATAVTVTWDVHDGAATLTVHDDGRGFSPERGTRDSAYGLVGMRERADVIGARLAVHSTPGAGTTITVHAGRAREEATT